MKTSIRLKKLQTEVGEEAAALEFLQSICNFADYYNTEVTVKTEVDHPYINFGFEVVGDRDEDGILHMVRFPNKGRVTE